MGKVYKVKFLTGVEEVGEETLLKWIEEKKVSPLTLVASEETGWEFKPLRNLPIWYQKDEGALLGILEKVSYVVVRGGSTTEVSGKVLVQWIKSGKVGPKTLVHEPFVPLEKTVLWQELQKAKAKENKE